jgi:hypothetical protein
MSDADCLRVNQAPQGRSSLAAAGDRSKVCFAPAPSIVTFLCNSPPFFLGRQCRQLRPMKLEGRAAGPSILKPGSLSSVYGSARDRKSPSLFGLRPCPSLQHLTGEQSYDQGDVQEQPWHLVQRKRWCKGERIAACKAQSTAAPRRGSACLN